ncbi:MAG TPA: glycosyltransferase [Sphingomicrobium sp.]|nr:glycosyltransferase [Sphingomicrobium sp.]
MTKTSLYISYDGMLEPLGQSQVLAYLERLASRRAVHLISFEKATDWRDAETRRQVAARIADAGIVWHPLRYHKRPSALATAFDIAAGSATAARIARTGDIGVIHARSYVAGLMALAAKRASGAALLFDMRGFWPEERVDGGLWPEDGLLYRTAKRAEKALLRSANHIVTLTEASVPLIETSLRAQHRAVRITVIPTCADLDRFRVQRPLQRKPFVLGHVGAVGTWYLLDEMMRSFGVLRRIVPDARFLIVNRGEHELIRARAAANGISADSIELTSAPHEAMPALIARMTAGLAIIKPAYSKIASAPTKLAEYLGCGIPCLGNEGVGDMAAILEGQQVGVALTGFSEAEIARGLERLVALAADAGIQARCRTVAEQVFSVEAGVAAYDRIYDELAGVPR